MKYIIDMHYNDDVILPEISLEDYDGRKEIITRLKYELDESIKKALINLGWTPPKD